MTLNNLAQNRLNEYFLTRLDMVPYTRGWLKGDCPSCGANFKFGVHIGNNRTNCFVCHYNPSPIDVVVDREGLENRIKAWIFIKTFKGLEYIPPKMVIPEFKNPSLPEHYKLISLGNNYISKIAREYWESRGFNIMESAMRGIGFCDEGPYQYRIIIPYFEMGKLVYFTGRQFLEFGTKFKNPEKEDTGLGKSQLIYNIDALSLYDSVNILESATNALTLEDNSIALGGKAISSWQKSTIIKSPVKKLSIILDPDALSEAYELALELSMFKLTRIVKLEGGDVNDLGKEKTKKYLKNTQYKDYVGFYREYRKFKNERTRFTHN